MRISSMSIFVLFLSSLFFISGTVEARSFAGRGLAISRVKHNYSNYRNHATPKAVNTKHRFRGALTGLLLGTILGSLFFSHGVAGTLIGWLFLGMIIYFVINFLRKRNSVVNK